MSGGVEWEVLVEPLKKLGWHHVLVLCFFICLMFFAVLNIITGVFVEGAMRRAKHEKDMKMDRELAREKEVRRQLACLFAEIDMDKTGFLDLAEFELMLSRPTTQACFSSIGLQFAQPWELFNLLDKEGTHKVYVEDFVQ